MTFRVPGIITIPSNNASHNVAVIQPQSNRLGAPFWELADFGETGEPEPQRAGSSQWEVRAPAAMKLSEGVQGQWKEPDEPA